MKKKIGRPSRYSIIIKNYELIMDCARNGYTNEEIARRIGVGKSTFQTYLSNNQEFQDSLYNAKDRADHDVINAVYKSAVGYEVTEEHREYDAPVGDQKPKLKSIKIIKKHIKPNIYAGLAWLYNRRRQNWIQRHNEILPTEFPKLPEFENLSDAELLKTIEKGISTK